jgi:hypothetical protein
MTSRVCLCVCVCTRKCCHVHAQLQTQALKTSTVAKEEKAAELSIQHHAHPAPHARPPSSRAAWQSRGQPSQRNESHDDVSKETYYSVKRDLLQISQRNGSHDDDKSQNRPHSPSKSVRFDQAQSSRQGVRAEGNPGKYSANSATSTMAALLQTAADQSPWQREQRIARDIALHTQAIHMLTKQKLEAQHEQADKVHSSNEERRGASGVSTQRLAAREMLSSTASHRVEHTLDLAAVGASSRAEVAASRSMTNSRPKKACRQNPSWNSLA